MAQPPDQQQLQRHITARSPSEFSLKEKFATWAKQFRNYCELLNIPNANRYRTLLSFMDAECFTIVENLNLNANHRANIFEAEPFRLIKNALSSREENVPPGYALKYRKQKENESIEKYAAELERLALEAFPDDQNIRVNRTLIESFIAGVRNDELAIKLLQENFDNLGPAINRAVEYFQALQTRRFIKTESDFRPNLEKVYTIKEAEETNKVNAVNREDTRNAAHNANTTGSKHQENAPHNSTASYPPFNAAQAQVPWQNMNPFTNQFPNTLPYWQNSSPSQNQFPFSGQYPYQNHPTPTYRFHNTKLNHVNGYNPQTNFNNRSAVICYHCSKPGHVRSNCRLLQQNRNQNFQGRTLYCNYCGKRGHNSSTCWHLTHTNSNQDPAAANSKNPFRPS